MVRGEFGLAKNRGFDATVFVRSAEAAGGELGGFFKRDVSDGNTPVSGRIAGGDLHFPQGPDVVGDFHDVLHLEFFDEAAFFIMAADLHEGTEFGVDPDVNDLVFAGAVFWLIDAELITGLTADVFVAFEFRVGPVKEAQCEILVGEIGAGDGLGDFPGGKVLSFAVDDFEKVEFLIRETHVKDAPGVVFVELELDVFSVQKEGDGAFFPVFGDVSFERFGFVELGEGGGYACALEDGVRVGLLGMGAGYERGGDECGFEIHGGKMVELAAWTSFVEISFKKGSGGAVNF